MRRDARGAVVLSFLLATGLNPAAVASERPAWDREAGSPRALLLAPTAAASRVSRSRPAGVAGGAQFLVESSSVNFGEVLPELPALVPSAVVIRVISARPWTLKLVPASMLTVSNRPELVSLSRLEWRSARGGGFMPFSGGAAVIIGSGNPTAGSGELVVVDLRLKIRNEDPLGNYGCSFRVELDRVP